MTLPRLGSQFVTPSYPFCRNSLTASSILASPSRPILKTTEENMTFPIKLCGRSEGILESKLASWINTFRSQVVFVEDEAAMKHFQRSAVTLSTRVGRSMASELAALVLSSSNLDASNTNLFVMLLLLLACSSTGNLKDSLAGG